MNAKEFKTNMMFLWHFSLDDFRNRYAGSVMGALWAFIQPMMTIIIYWFIFQIGFKSQPVDNYPFILWLVSGLVPWFFISDGISTTTASMVEYNYLVKKILFNINILPLIKILSCFLVQFFLVLITILLFIFFGFMPDIYYLQLPYYMLYVFVLITGIGYCTASLYPFFKDLSQIVSIIIQFIFWLTPIVWDFNIMPSFVRRILIFNPLYYAIAGYRDVFVNKQFFGVNWKMGLYYWCIALLILTVGLKIFKKMKIHFADVL